MEIGLGHLRYPPSVFWALSFAEWAAAIDGYLESIGQDPQRAEDAMTRADLGALMEQYPDGDRDDP